MLHRNTWRKILRSFSNAPRKFRAAEVINRDRSSEGQSYQRHFSDDGHGVRGSITGGKDDQRRDRASLMRAMPNRNVRIGSWAALRDWAPSFRSTFSTGHPGTG